MLKSGKNNIGANIKTEIAHGKPKAQALAIALSVAKVPKAPAPTDEYGKKIKHLSPKRK